MRKWMAVGVLALAACAKPAIVLEIDAKRAELRGLQAECAASGVTQTCNRAVTARYELDELRREWNGRRQSRNQTFTREKDGGRDIDCGIDPTSGRPYCF